MGSTDYVVTTGVDRLVEFLRGKGQLELNVVSKKLNVSSKTIQTWVDFLVEEEIIGVEYKFTTPYIYLIDKNKGASNNMSDLKQAFRNNAKKNSLSDNKTEFLWKNQVMGILEDKKQFFYDEAKKRDLNNIDVLWANYKKEAVFK